jgi:hypothetical protein
MIPIRVPAGLKVVLASERRMNIPRGHPLYLAPCPVCDRKLGDCPTVLVFVGIRLENRADSGENGYTIGGSVSVHAECAGVSDIEPDPVAEAKQEDADNKSVPGSIAWDSRTRHLREKGFSLEADARDREAAERWRGDIRD